ncbi:MAG: glycosyltransferase [Bacteroidia bacterium]|nr:glycosyltransferase [Bacteroidia bacterium]
MSSFFYFVDEVRTPFVINDIRRVAEKYETVYLFSIDRLQGKEALPENVVVFENFIDWTQFKPFRILFSNFFSILTIYLSECIALQRFLPFKKSVAVLASNIFKAEQIVQILSKHPPTFNFQLSTFYSFWFYDCIYLAWLKKKGKIKTAITRAHGGDLYEERSSLSGNILFRHFQMGYLDGVYSVSGAGTFYLQKKYSRYKRKIKTIFLGSSFHESLSRAKMEGEFVMVTCARIRNIKRIHKVAEMLQHIDFPLIWYHIGDENLEAKNDTTIPKYIKAKEELKTKGNITYIPLGQMENERIFEFYSVTPINLFVSLSQNEGLPISMMEAASFGIPVLSTDVGGCKEIVNEQTGILIPLETEMKEVARIITNFKDSAKNTEEYRKGVRKFWEENFDAEKNYEKLFEELEF